MNDAVFKTRFAPSPTGYLHLGNARTALFSALHARHMGAVFLLRIEDTDPGRSHARYTEALQEDLRWLGLDWQEGPGAEGTHAPYAQSQRGEIYQRHFTELETRGLAYPCFCSARELELSRKVQLSMGRPPRYAGTCAHLSEDERRKRREQGVPATLRFRVNAGEKVEFDDLVRGTQSFATDDIGDFIIRRADGTAAFFFSNAVDDALMGVTHVLRGEDHFTNTPRQLLLQRALDLPAPRYGHITMIVGADGTPLSKRTGSRSLRELREEGYLPGAVVNYLARLGHYYENNAYMDFDTLAREFELVRLGRAPAHFDPAQLLHWQREAVAHASIEEIAEWMGDKARALIDESQHAAFIAAVRPNAGFPADMSHWARVIAADELELHHDARVAVRDAGGEFFAVAIDAFDAHARDFKSFTGVIKQRTGAKGKALFSPLRAALTGETNGPELAPLLALLPQERARARLEKARNICNQM